MALLNSWTTYCISLGAALLVIRAVLRRSRSTLKDIRGPGPSSFWLGESSLCTYNAIEASVSTQVTKATFAIRKRSEMQSFRGYKSSEALGRPMGRCVCVASIRASYPFANGVLHRMSG